MRPVSDRLMQDYQRLDGCRFRAFLSEAKLSGTRDVVPYRLFMTRKPPVVKVGDVVCQRGTARFILMEQPEEFEWARTFRATHISKGYEWKRPVKELDPVAKVSRDTGRIVPLGNIYVNFEKALLEEMIGFKDVSYRFITGQPVQVGDIVGDRVVKTIIEVLGVYVAEAQ